MQNLFAKRLTYYDVFVSYMSFYSRAVTRGVNKGAKEDFRAALERQIARSDENFEPLLRGFFQEEADSLVN